MNPQFSRDEENVARLIQAGFGAAARPNPSVRQETWQRLRAQLRAESKATPESAPNRAPLIINGNTHYGRKSFMNRLKTWWGIGLSALAAAGIFSYFSPTAEQLIANLAEKARTAAQVDTSIHLSGRMRTPPRDNFSLIIAGLDFVPVEFWKQTSPELKWRINKGDREAVMDGDSTILFIKPEQAVKTEPTPSAFDTEWLHQMADLNEHLKEELAVAKSHGWLVKLAKTRGADGKAKSLVSIETKYNLTNQFDLKSPFMMLPEMRLPARKGKPTIRDMYQKQGLTTPNMRRVYSFDQQSSRLEAIQVYLAGVAGDPLIFEIQKIEYNQEPADSTYQLSLPEDVAILQDPVKLPDNEKYESLTPEQAARAFFEACGRSDWKEAEKFYPNGINNRFKNLMAGLQVINIGAATAAEQKPTMLVPFEIKFSNGTVKTNLVGLQVYSRVKRWMIIGKF